jgi:hypothetical protein
VPYFWSDWYGHKLQMVGEHTDEVEVVGEAHGPWVVLFRSGDLLGGAVTLDLPGRIMKLRRMIATGTSWDEAREAVASRPLVGSR